LTITLNKDVKAFAEGLRRQPTLKGKVEEVLKTKQFNATQKESEITGLLTIIQEMKPKRVCEIGAYHGGTLALFCTVVSPNANILSLDINYSPKQIRAFPYFSNHHQKIVCIGGNSQASSTLTQFNQWLNGEQLDLLFIDGDHSFTGVSKDFELYSPYVRPGGCIVFHDIIEDFKTRHGIETKAFTGGVPQFWSQIKESHKTTQELIDDPEQDGFGIGILWWDSTQGIQHGPANSSMGR